jgi:hypothetical protein
VEKWAEKCSTNFSLIIKTEIRMAIRALFPFCMNSQRGFINPVLNCKEICVSLSVGSRK